MSLTIGGIEVGGANPCRFVAELSNNANGDFTRATRLIDAAKSAGTDFVKFQAYLPSELIALRGDGPAPRPWGEQGFTMETLYEKAATPFDWFPALAQYCADIGMPWFSSVFGKESLEVLQSLDCAAYKIAKFEADAAWLQYLALSTGKPVIVSSPDANKVSPIASATLYCPGGYPCEIDDVKLPQSFNGHGLLGLSSHCLDSRLPVAAVARGCKLIEMHFMLAEEPSELEANVSLDQYAFAKMVTDVRATERMLA